MQKMHTVLLSCLLCIVLCSCTAREIQVGTVAKVNDTVITVDELKKRYDMLMMQLQDENVLETAAVEEIYTQILLDMIVEVLIEQALIAQGIPIEESEVESTIAEIKKDYTTENFNDMLAERYIEYDVWRQTVRARYLETLFIQQVVQPKVTIQAEEVESFFEKNRDVFVVPARIEGVIVASENKKEVETIIALLQRGNNVAQMIKQFPNAYVEKNVFDVTLFSDALAKIILTPPSKKVTPIEKNTDGIYMAVIVENVMKQKNKKLAEVYPLVERQLLDEKSLELFQEVLASMIDAATISVAPQFEPALKNLQLEYRKK